LAPKNQAFQNFALLLEENTTLCALSYSKNFGLPICFIVLVTEPPVREQLPDIGNVFFLEVAYGLFGGGEKECTI